MKKRLTCSVKYFCLGAFLIFLGSVLLCGLGFTIVLPHEATRHWPEVTCHVINSSYSTRICSCEHQAREMADAGRCMDSYPCLHILTSYSLPHTPIPLLDPESRKTDGNSASYSYNETKSRDLLLNRTVIATLYRSWEDEFYKTCTLHECGDEHWNTKHVRDFQLLWGHPGQTFPCYYDPDDVTQVILERTPTSQMIHAVLWPTVFLFAGILIWLGLWVGCWEVDMTKYSQPSIDRSKAPKAHGITLIMS